MLGKIVAVFTIWYFWLATKEKPEHSCDINEGIWKTVEGFSSFLAAPGTGFCDFVFLDWNSSSDVAKTLLIRLWRLAHCQLNLVIFAVLGIFGVFFCIPSFRTYVESSWLNFTKCCNNSTNPQIQSNLSGQTNRVKNVKKQHLPGLTTAGTEYPKQGFFQDYNWTILCLNSDATQIFRFATLFENGVDQSWQLRR